MVGDIAVFTNEQRETASLYQPGKITVYHKLPANWEILREQNFCLNRDSGILGLRKSMNEALKFMQQCRIFVASSVVGVPFFELEKSGYSIWEFAGKPPEFLDYIWQQEAQARQQENNQVKIPSPFETTPGSYQISLNEIQGQNYGISTKQALLPFLRKAEFRNLEVRCRHVPPWLEAELISCNLTADIMKISQDEFRVFVNKAKALI